MLVYVMFLFCEIFYFFFFNFYDIIRNIMLKKVKNYMIEKSIKIGIFKLNFFISYDIYRFGFDFF